MSDHSAGRQQWFDEPPEIVRINVSHKFDEAGFGSGLLVGHHHVVTCLHVLIDPNGPKRVGNSGSLRPADTATVMLADGQDRPAKFVMHGFPDIALLRLTKPAAVSGSLDVADWPTGQQKLVAWGFDSGDLSCPKRSDFPADLDSGIRSANGLRELVTGDGTVSPGFSGGPIYLQDSRTFIGLSRLGGEQVDFVQLIARDLVLDFLSTHLPHVQKPGTPSAPDVNRTPASQAAQAWGFRPQMEWGDGTYQFIIMMSKKAAYIRTTPLPDLTPRYGLPNDLLMPELPTTPAEVERCLALHRRACVQVLRDFVRLPTIDEIRALAGDLLSGLPRNAPRYTAAGGVPDMRLFRDDAGRILPPPHGVCEWVQTADGPRRYEWSGRDYFRPADNSTHGPAIMRLAFDV